jgi:hypothetical protein
VRSATKRRHCVDELVGIAKTGPDRDDRVGRHQNSGCPLHPAALPLPPRSRQARQWSDQAAQHGRDRPRTPSATRTAKEGRHSCRLAPLASGRGRTQSGPLARRRTQGQPVTGYLLDTNIISDVTKPAPSPELLAWMADQADDDLFISALTVAEIRRGLLDVTSGVNFT